MSSCACCTYCPESQPTCQCGQVSAVGHSPSTQPSGQLPCAACIHTHSSHQPAASYCPVNGCGCHFHHSPSHTQFSCGHSHFSPSHAHNHTHHHPAVASPLLFSRQQTQTLSSPLAIVHPQHHNHHQVGGESSLLHRPTSRKQLGLFPTRALTSNEQMSLSSAQRSNSSERLDVKRSTIHQRLEQSPLSRPHPHHLRPHPQHQGQLYTSERGQSSGRLFPPSLEFSPASSKGDSPPLPSGNSFQLSVVSEASQSIQDSPLTKKADQGAVLPSGAPVVHDETINYSSLAEVMVTPSVATETDPPMVAIETDSIDPEDQLAIPVPPTQATRAESKENITVPPVEQAMVKATPSKSSKGVAKKTKGPILLYKWSFKVMANNIIVLLGYKSQNKDELKWRSGPVTERLSASLLMTKSGQLYHLMGHLDVEETTKESPQISKQVLRKFRKGFPSQWMELLLEAESPPVQSQPKEKPLKPKHAPLVPDLSKVKKEGGASSVKRKSVKEKARKDSVVMTTPVVSDDVRTPRSSFVNSLKRSSHGRTIKPAMFTVSSCLQSCSDLYSYDWYGNFTGITSVIDLTVGDDPLPPRKRRRRIKQEPAEDVPSDSSSSVMNNTDADCIGVPSNALKTKKSGKESTREKPPPALGRKRNEWKSVRLYREEFEVEVVHRGVCETSEGEGELVRQQFKGHGSKFKSQTNSTGEAVEGLNEESDYDMGRTEQLRGRTRKGRTTEIVETTTDVDDSEVENSHSKNQVKGRLVPARRRRVKMDTTTSEDSEVESNRRSRPTNPRPAPDRKEKMDKQKVSENSVLDMSPSIRPSGQPRREEERARRTHHGVQTLREGDGSEILGDEGNEDGKIFSDDNLRNLRQVVHSVPALTANFWEVVAMKLGTGHTPQQCSNAYRNQKGNASPLKSSEQTAVPQKPRASVTSLKQTEKGKSKPGPATEEVTGVSSKDEFEGGTSHCGRNLRKSRRRRVKMDTMTSEDSEAESNHRSQPTKPRPAPDRKEKMEKQKVSENSVLDMSPSIRPSGQPRREEERARRTHHGVQTLREGDGSEILGDEEQIRREKTSKRPALAMDSSDSLYGNSERLPGKMSDADLRHLRQIVQGVPTLTTNFWEVVARRLGTGHTPQQCSTAYHEQSGRMKPLSARPKKKEKSQEMSITAKSGTLKRKRQLRDALEHFDSGYYDDIFDSTPFKKIKKSVQIPESQDDSFEDEEDEPSHSMHTPSIARARVGAPRPQTPNLCDYLTTPDFKSGLKRAAADHVIYNAQKAQKGVKKSVTFKKQSVSKSLVCEQKLRNIRTGELTTLRMFEDSDDDSSESNPFDDVLTML